MLKTVVLRNILVENVLSDFLYEKTAEIARNLIQPSYFYSCILA